ncbi:3-ketoacyl-CoA synthase 6 [Dendrobium catenatum]|uniref:3-ketoacyl-CoA synthase n=1 Tax=Dendrobium catenatum TaxID=906689 RepID=A0A2I0WWB7_9ASPA|nr:3-ketoacyl-CoA synthase 6 [Dendrobium catenatum]PKU79958.1 3-ketoacyl-CoA synthase 5 [Dendrobium catenatum]
MEESKLSFVKLITSPSSPPNSSPILFLLTFAAFLLASFLLFHRRRRVYLLDFSCFKPPGHCRVPFASFEEHGRLILGDELGLFMLRVLEKSGLGEETALPVSAHYIEPVPVPTLAGSRDEAELVIFSAVDDVLRKTGVDPTEIDILIINCNSFFPMPSLTAMVVNRYKLRSTVKSFNLSGMGCSCGPISVGLAKDLFQANPSAGLALIVSTEIITSPAWYMGRERSMLVSNCLFRMGGAAVLLSSPTSHRRRSLPHPKYELLHALRTHTGAHDSSYRCLYQVEDSDGNLGISLSKQVMEFSAVALKLHLTRLGLLVLPWDEKLRFLASYFLPKNKKLAGSSSYVPQFRRAFEHFCVHAGGKAVVDGVQRSLGLTEQEVEASRMALHRFGNTSSSSVWYELGYTEAKGRVRKKDRIWQLGLGSGFKCNSAVWRSLRDVKGKEEEGAWSDCIDSYPVPLAP